MTDLVAELRKRADRLETERRTGRTTQGHRDSLASGLRQAADLLEADPLYKAAPAMRDLLVQATSPRGRKEPTLGEAIEWAGRARTILATLPKEHPSP